MTSIIINTQGIGKIIFDRREERLHREGGCIDASDNTVVVSPFGGVDANSHRPSTACSSFDSLGIGAAVHPSPTFIEPYSGELLAKMVTITMCSALIVGMRDKTRFSFFLMWFVCICLNFVSAKSLATGNGVLAHQMGITGCGLACVGLVCKIFMDVVYAGGFGETTTAATMSTSTSGAATGGANKGGAVDVSSVTPEAAAKVAATAGSFDHVVGSGNVVGGVTAAEAAAQLRAEIAAKGGRRIITESDVKRRMDLLNTERLRANYAEAALASRSKINEHLTRIAANEKEKLALLTAEPVATPTATIEGGTEAAAITAGEEAAVAAAATPAAPAASIADTSSSSANPTMAAATAATAAKKKSSMAVNSTMAMGGSSAAAAASSSAVPTQQAPSALTATFRYAYKFMYTTRLLARHVRRTPHAKAACVAGAVAYFNYRRLEWWAAYVPEVRSLKGKEDSSSGVDVYKGTYSDAIDADLLLFAKTQMK